MIVETCSVSPSASSEGATISPWDDIEFSLTALVTSLATGAVFASGIRVNILKKSPGFALLAPYVIVLLLFDTVNQSPCPLVPSGFDALKLFPLFAVSTSRPLSFTVLVRWPG